MPELPEIETIRRLLSLGSGGQPGLLGEPIVSAELLWQRTLAAPSPGEFLERIAGRRIAEITRRGKYLIFLLDRDALLFHLRMSGNLLVEPRQAPVAPHHRLLIFLGSGRRLAFNDTRKFGRAWLVADPAEVTANLGPEPLDPSFSAGRFSEMLQQSRRQLKPLLMDQAFLAGLGNIYTDEALHRARLHPLTPGNTLDFEHAQALLTSIRTTLTAGIEHNGASIDWVYRGGSFQNHFRVYGRKGQPCPVCGSVIEKIVVGQRGTHFCPGCQPSIKEDQP